MKLLDIFEKAGVFELAVEAGQIAVNLDPNDGQLAARLKEMLASATIQRGRFEESAGKEGASGRASGMWRSRLSSRRRTRSSRLRTRRTGSCRRRRRTMSSVRPTPRRSRDTGGRCWTGASPRTRCGRCCCIRRRSRRRGSSDSVNGRGGQSPDRAAQAADAEGEAGRESGDAGLREEVVKAEASLLDKEIEELRLQVEHYPTNQTLKFELGKRLHAKGESEAAIGLFQKAEEDPQHRRAVLRYKAEAFLAIGWADEAVQTYRARWKAWWTRGASWR